MITLLKNQYVDYLIGKRPSFIQFNPNDLILKMEITSDKHFDIMDKKATICQPIGFGSATYRNKTSKRITFIDYENFIDQLPTDLQRGHKRCDFIAYATNDSSFFILNELSQSARAKEKMSDARKQLHSTAFNLSETPAIKSFIDQFKVKKCIFSNKNKLIPTPDNIADAFSLIHAYLPEPIILNYQPIKKLGFELIETAIVEV